MREQGGEKEQKEVMRLEQTLGTSMQPEEMGRHVK